MENGVCCCFTAETRSERTKKIVAREQQAGVKEEERIRDEDMGKQVQDFHPSCPRKRTSTGRCLATRMLAS